MTVEPGAPTVGPGGRRLRRDGLPAFLFFVFAPFAALGFGLFAHPLQLLDSEEEVRERVERWRPPAAEAARRAGVPADLLLAVVAVESKGRPGAVSSAGAVGLTQVLPATALGERARLGLPCEDVDLFDPATNLEAGASYLGAQVGAFGGDEPLALAAYHAGPAGPARWRREEPGTDGLALVRARASSVTRAYVQRVLRWRDRFRGPPAGASK